MPSDVRIMERSDEDELIPPGDKPISLTLVMMTSNMVMQLVAYGLRTDP